MRIQDILKNLVDNHTVRDIKLEQLNEDGEVGCGKFRNTERLTITFNDHTKLVIDTFCSGVSENTSFSFKLYTRLSS